MIFKLFSQITLRVRKLTVQYQPGSGTGLGMAISFGIIEEHNGTIEVESVEGEGSEISICLPL